MSGVDVLARAEVCAQLGEYAVMIRDPKFHCIGAFDDESSAISLAEAWNARVDAMAELVDKARDVLDLCTDHADDEPDTTCPACKAMFDLREILSRIQPDGQG